MSHIDELRTQAMLEHPDRAMHIANLSDDEILEAAHSTASPDDDEADDDDGTDLWADDEDDDDLDFDTDLDDEDADEDADDDE